MSAERECKWPSVITLLESPDNRKKTTRSPPAGGERVVFFRLSGDSKSVMTDGHLHSLSADIDANGELHHQLKLHIAADREYAPIEEGSVSPEARLPKWHPDRARHQESRARILNNIISNVSNNSVAPSCTSWKGNEATVPAGLSR